MIPKFPILKGIKNYPRRAGIKITKFKLKTGKNSAKKLKKGF